MGKINTIGDYAHGRKNNFDFIRFTAATMVLFSHCYPLSKGAGLEDPLARGTHFINFGALGVYIFFMISGFLVTGSFCKRSDIINFFKARILRIFPGLIIAILFTMFFIGGLSTTLPLGDYIRNFDTFRYAAHNILLYKISYYLPGVFTNNPYPGAINGSLWTLPVEFKMYIFVGAIGLIGLFKNKKFFNSAYIAGFAALIILNRFGVNLVSPVNRLMIIYFILGSAVWINKDKIPVHPGIFGFLWVLIGILSKTMLLPYIFPIALTYGIFFIAYYPGIKLNGFGKYGDFSYGMYIYAFPVQQMIAANIKGVGPLVMFPAAFLFTLLLSILSWHFVEKPAMGLKDVKLLKAKDERGIPA